MQPVQVCRLRSRGSTLGAQVSKLKRCFDLAAPTNFLDLEAGDITGLGSAGWKAIAQADGSGGTEVFLLLTGREVQRVHGPHFWLSKGQALIVCVLARTRAPK